MKPATKAIRCAIYTRKSSEEGLDQDFNSLHAQRDACAAYILSQAGEGWTALDAVYDDGGYSGGSMERPGLKRLLADIGAGRIDVVVVYKVDRLTRSLTDFARMIEVFDQTGASFVSVTQAFNTTSSMGRLTLNVLLSFAQFEREVTGERIRDKIAASKRKGMWMGGNLALGYEPAGRTLTVNPQEAEIVRMIFRRYLELGSVHRLKEELERLGVVSKRWTSKSGSVRGGVAMSRGALFYLLRNRLYLGEIPHKLESYPGQHPAIIEPAIFDAVQAKLDEGAHGAPDASAAVRGRPRDMPLAGLIFDSAGHPMSPVKARKRGGATYRYYVSTALQVGARDKAGACPRVAASLVEDMVADRLSRMGIAKSPAGYADWAPLREAINRVVVRSGELALTLNAEVMARVGGERDVAHRVPEGDALAKSNGDLVLTIPVTMTRSGAGVIAVGPEGRPALNQPSIDKTLYAALIRAETWKRRLLAGEVVSIEALAREEDLNASYAGRLIRVAFLSPDLKRAVLDGRQPQRLNLQTIMTRDLPSSWQAQRAMFRA